MLTSPSQRFRLALLDKIRTRNFLKMFSYGNIPEIIEAKAKVAILIAKTRKPREWVEQDAFPQRGALSINRETELLSSAWGILWLCWTNIRRVEHFPQIILRS